ADAATTHSTLDQARQLVGRKLAGVSVQTFKGTGIMKVKARSTRKLLAQRTAEAVSSVLLTRSASGDLGIPSLKLTEIDPPALPPSRFLPQPRRTVPGAPWLGLGLGLPAAVLRESLPPKGESADDLAEVAGAPVYAEIPAESAVLKMHSPEDLATQPRL